jgi:predicted anti-sigma-YlaC factor YlaD
MKLGKYSIQALAIIVGCMILVIAVWPSHQSGIIDESVSKFAKAIGVMFQAVIYGAFSGNGDQQ